MAWNEPDGDNRDPWGQRRPDQGPPDLDEVMRKFQQRLNGLFGKKGTGGGGRSNRGEGGGPLFFGALAVAVGVLVFLLSFYRIEAQERGVVLRFGKEVAVLMPGPHLRWPRPIEQVITVDVDAIREFTVDATMLTQDENIIDIELATQYRIDSVIDYLFQVSDPDDSVRQVTESAVREIIGKNTLDFVLTEGRSQIAAKVSELLQSIINNYKTGIIVTSVNMQPAKPPEEVKAAFDDAIKAREDEQRKINEAEAYRNEVLERAQGEGDRLRLQAEAYKEQMMARAEGEASRFGQILTEYEAAPEVTRERLYIETMEHILSDTTKVILDVDSGNSMMYLPIDQIVRQSVEASDRRAVRQLSEPPTAEVPRSESQSMESATRSRDSVARDRRTR
mgnify:CR=1 FL=1